MMVRQGVVCVGLENGLLAKVKLTPPPAKIVHRDSIQLQKVPIRRQCVWNVLLVNLRMKKGLANARDVQKENGQTLRLVKLHLLLAKIVYRDFIQLQKVPIRRQRVWNVLLEHMKMRMGPQNVKNVRWEKGLIIRVKLTPPPAKIVLLDCIQILKGLLSVKFVFRGIFAWKVHQRRKTAHMEHIKILAANRDVKMLL